VTFNRLYKKIAASIILILLCFVISILVNYSVTGVFINYNRKLPIYNVDTKEKKVALTFDVSVGGIDNTKKILDILDKYNGKATFFLIGVWVDNNKDMVKEISDSGNEIGNHSDKHPSMTSISKDRIIQEINTTDNKIYNIIGKKTSLFRCPSGAYNDLVLDTVKNTGHFCIQWDVDSIDWRESGASIEKDRILSKTKPGSILLFHNNAKYTPENLPVIMDKLAKEGYKFVTVSDLIYKNDYQIDSQGKQKSLSN
jgi:peptidoglycan-N-acetylglucosamine deacetylase